MRIGREALGCGAAVWLVLATAGGSSTARADDDTTYRTATGLLNRGMYEAAAEEYRKFLKEEPGDARAVTARYGLAVSLSRLNRSTEATAELDVVLKDRDFEFRADALLLRARCHMEAGEFEAAAARLKEVREKHGDSPRAGAAAGLEGEALYRAGRFSQARPILEAAVDRAADAPAKIRIGYFLAMTEIALGDAKQGAERLRSLAGSADGTDWPARLSLAEGQARQAIGEERRAVELFGKAAASPDAGIRRPALLGLGQVLRRSGDAEGAAEALGRLVDEGASAEAGPARVELARCWLDAARPDRALSLLSDAEGSEGVRADDVSYWTARAEAALGKHREAAARLGAALKADSGSPLAANMLYDRAAALSKSGAAEESLNAFNEFARRFPDHALAADAALARASLLHSAGKYTESAAVCGELVDDDLKSRAATARLLLAENEYMARHDKAAETAYRRFVKDFSEDPRAWRAGVRLGLVLARLGRNEEARSALELAMKTSAGAPPSADQQGLVRAACAALGDLAFAEEAWAAAESWYLKAAPEDGPDSVGTLLRLGLSIHRQGNMRDAISVYDRVIAVAGNTEGPGLHAAFERGQAYAELGDLAAARADLESVIKAERKTDTPRFTPHALRQLASIASREGRAGDAAELLGRLAEAPGAGGEAAVERSAALLAAGRAAEAEAILRTFLKDHGDDDGAARARVQLAMAVARQERYQEAVALINAAERDAEDSARPALLYEKAWALKSLNKIGEAAAAYEMVLASDPPPSLEAHAALDLAQIEASAGRCERAVGWLDRAAQASAKDPAALGTEMAGPIAYLRGVCAYRMERWEEAARLLTAYAAEHADDSVAPSALLLAGESLLRLGNPAAAAERLKAASAAADPKVRGPALLRLGEALATCDRWLESEEVLLAYLKEFGGEELWFQARFGVGWAREQQGKHESAIEAYREVTSKHEGPTAARAQFQVGECLFAMKRHDEAVKELLKVDILFAYPEWSAAALYEAGRCLEEAGKAAEARQQFSAVVERFADSEWSSPAKQRLRGLEPAALPGRNDKVEIPASPSRRTGR